MRKLLAPLFCWSFLALLFAAACKDGPSSYHPSTQEYVDGHVLVTPIDFSNVRVVVDTTHNNVCYVVGAGISCVPAQRAAQAERSP